ncbi:MAG: LysM peptidoglycan-binding domain-containing protein [Ilumatobacteraceae bacterium]
MGSNPTLSAKVSRLILVPLVASGFVVLHNPDTAFACATPYTAKHGDSWWSIAEKHGLSLNKVLKLNKAKQSTKILVGDSVCVAVATTKPKPGTVRYTPKEVIQIIREEWPDELEERAIQIARRESKLNPRAIGIPNDCCYGLFQIYYRWHKGWLPAVGVENASQLLDPRLNARAAFRMYQRNNGWGPWE